MSWLLKENVPQYPSSGSDELTLAIKAFLQGRFQWFYSYVSLSCTLGQARSSSSCVLIGMQHGELNQGSVYRSIRSIITALKRWSCRKISRSLIAQEASLDLNLLQVQLPWQWAEHVIIPPHWLVALDLLFISFSFHLFAKVMQRQQFMVWWRGG